MKKLFIAMMLMAATSQAQTVLINGQQYPQNDTVIVTTQYANIEVVSPEYVTYCSVVYVGVTSFYVPDFQESFMVTSKPKLFRVNWFVGGTKTATYRVYLKR